MKLEQREILFRGQKIKTGEWRYGFAWGSQDPTKKVTAYRAWFIYDACSMQIREAEYYEVKPETVTQYTGLKDCKGKKIFEGDIVRFDYSTWLSVITYNPLKAAFQMFYIDKNIYSGEKTKKDLDSRVLEDTEISGNIFDNPELLDQKIMAEQHG